MIIVIHQRTDIILAFLAVQYEDEKKIKNTRAHFYTSINMG